MPTLKSDSVTTKSSSSSEDSEDEGGQVGHDFEEHETGSKDQGMAIADVLVEGDRPSTPERRGPTNTTKTDAPRTPKSPTPVHDSAPTRRRDGPSPSNPDGPVQTVFMLSPHGKNRMRMKQKELMLAQVDDKIEQQVGQVTKTSTVKEKSPNAHTIVSLAADMETCIPVQEAPTKRVTMRSKARRSEEEIVPDLLNVKRPKLFGVKDSKHDKGAQEEVTVQASGEGVAPKLKSALKKPKKKASSLHVASDLSRGFEASPVFLVMPERSAPSLSKFRYIRESHVGGEARLNVTFDSLRSDDCCDCTADCISADANCNCSLESGGEFAYNKEGLLKEKFINQVDRDTELCEKGTGCYCSMLALEDGESGECEGHVPRTFIRECNARCGCFVTCGNMIVQHGMKLKMEVFYTGDRGWGVRTTQNLAKGVFLFELVGKVVTNSEMLERNYLRQRYLDFKNSYAVQLDGVWRMEAELGDDGALCIDATHYANVSRFLNHCCGDSTVLDMPVKIDEADNRYYHIAFFPKRGMLAVEELTWDYGIDFGSSSTDNPLFRCLCGSVYCRDTHLSNRCAASALVKVRVTRSGRVSG